jgi:hypothetical protein
MDMKIKDYLGMKMRRRRRGVATLQLAPLNTSVGDYLWPPTPYRTKSKTSVFPVQNVSVRLRSILKCSLLNHIIQRQVRVRELT